jgi:hypothetical protein
VNVASFTIEFDEVGQTGTQTLEKGMSFGCSVVRTNPALPAYVTLVITHAAADDEVVIPDYRILQWTMVQEVLELPQFFEETKRAFITEATGVASYTRLARSNEQVQGIFTIETDSMQMGTCWGLSNSPFPDTNGEHLWGLVSLANHLIWEGGIPWSGITTNDNSANVALQIRDTGAAIQFWYKEPAGSWTLAYESMEPYTPDTAYWVDFAGLYDAQRIAPTKIYQY